MDEAVVGLMRVVRRRRLSEGGEGHSGGEGSGGESHAGDMTLAQMGKSRIVLWLR
jgi:hypothetical protein